MLGWWFGPDSVSGFAQLDGVTWHAERAADARELDYLAPFADAIGRARKVRVLGGAGFEGVDLQRSAFRGAPLIAHAEVAFSLDLPLRAPRPDRVRRALIAGDAEGDLPGARAEIRGVAHELGARGWQVQTLSGGALRSSALQRDMSALGFLHYAGHARQNAETELGAAIVLPTLELTVADILALRAPPELVVLSACEAAGAAPEQAASVGVAQAFVLAGSSAAVAATRTIRDADAGRFARALSAGIAAGLPIGQAYRAAVTHLIGSDVDWSAYRLILP